jgi:hypothetical protein
MNIASEDITAAYSETLLSQTQWAQEKTKKSKDSRYQGYNTWLTVPLSSPS